MYNKKSNWNGKCHVVNGEGMKSGMVDMHSHGLADEIGTELQYVIRRSDDSFVEIQELFSEIAHRVINHKLKLKDHSRFKSDLFGIYFELFKTKDSAGKTIYRVIEPDMQGRFPKDSKSPYFSKQYESPYVCA